MIVFNEKLIDNGDMDDDIESSPIGLPNMIGYSVQAVWTGSTIDGTIKLQCSVDPCSQARTTSREDPTHWSDVEDSEITINAAGDFVWNVSDVFYPWVRIVYTDGSGGTSDGVLNVRINAKGV